MNQELTAVEKEDLENLEAMTYQAVASYAERIGVNPARLLKELDIFDDDARPENPLWFIGENDKLGMHAITAMNYACSFRDQYAIDKWELMEWASATSYLLGALSMPLATFNPVDLGRKGAAKRHAQMAKLRSWAIQQYKAGEWKSANQAAHSLKASVIEHGRTIGACLTEENAQRTIAEWFRKSA